MLSEEQRTIKSIIIKQYIQDICWAPFKHDVNVLVYSSIVSKKKEQTVPDLYVCKFLYVALTGAMY